VTPTLPARAPRRDFTENRAALLAAARVMLNRQPDASLEAIAAEAGLSRRAVYGHFASRDELLRELVTIGSMRVAAALEPIVHPDPVVRLALIASRLWHEVEGVLVMTVFAVRGDSRHHIDDALGPLRRGVLAAIVDGRERGVIRTDIEADRLARLLEDSMFAVLAEATEHPLSNDEGRRLVVLSALGTIGLGWRDADRFIAAHPELSSADDRGAAS
jgi:AcrR family transcriptional regulator